MKKIVRAGTALAPRAVMVLMLLLGPGCRPVQRGPFAWSGAVTPTSAVVKVGLPPGEAEGAKLHVCPVGSDAPHPAPVTASGAGSGRPVVVRFEPTGLRPGTTYSYVPEWGNELHLELAGQFRTFPAAERPQSFTVAFASCARTGSRHPVFETIRRHHPLFFLHMGDLHYENIRREASERQFRDAYARVLASPAQSRLYRTVPLVYVWDDHDYGPNNSDASSPTRPTARRLYREYVPHYPLAANGAHAAAEPKDGVPIYHAFSVGRVRFIVTDLRSERAGDSMMGAAQKAWFLSELAASAGDHALLVWVSPVSWAGSPESGKDRWSGYSNERKEIANFVKAKGLQGRLCVLSGDAHMLAIDSGKNTDFADGGGARIPLFHAAALDQRGTIKTRGRKFTHGLRPGGGQFGLMTVRDDGTTLAVRWSGRNAADEELMSHEFRVPPAPN